MSVSNRLHRSFERVMLPAIDVSVRTESTGREEHAFQLLEGDLLVLEEMLPESEFIPSFSGGKNVMSVSGITKFKEELACAKPSPSVDGKLVYRSALHTEFGTVDSSDLRVHLITRIDVAVRAVLGI